MTSTRPVAPERGIARWASWAHPTEAAAIPLGGASPVVGDSHRSWSDRRRVAVTLEQCWHRVPGGTARAALESIRALQATRSGELDLVGVSARHRAPPAAAVDADRSRSRPCRCPGSRCTSRGTGCAARPCERATGPVDVIHATGMAMPPPSAPLVVTVHDLAFLHDPGAVHPARGAASSAGRSSSPAATPTLVICPSQATLDDCLANGFDRARLRLVPWGIDAAARRRRRRSPASAPGSGSTGRYVLWTGTIEPRKNLPRCSTRSARVDRSDVDWCSSARRAGTRTSSARSARLRRPGAGPRLRRPRRPAGALRRGRGVLLPEPRRASACPVLEAMAQGTPVVTSAGTATAEVGRRRRACCVDPTTTVDAWPRPSRGCSTTPSPGNASGRRADGRAAESFTLGAHGRRPSRRSTSEAAGVSDGAADRAGPGRGQPALAGARAWSAAARSTRCGCSGPSPTSAPDDLDVTPVRERALRRRPTRTSPSASRTVVAPVVGHVAARCGSVAESTWLAAPHPARPPGGRCTTPAARCRCCARSPGIVHAPRPAAAEHTRALRPGQARLHPRPWPPDRCAARAAVVVPDRVHGRRRRATAPVSTRPRPARAARCRRSRSRPRSARAGGRARALRPRRSTLLALPGDHLRPQEPRDPRAPPSPGWSSTIPTCGWCSPVAPGRTSRSCGPRSRRYGLDDRVVRTGRIPEADLDVLYRERHGARVPVPLRGLRAPGARGDGRGCPVAGQRRRRAARASWATAAVLLDPLDAAAWAAAIGGSARRRRHDVPCSPVTASSGPVTSAGRDAADRTGRGLPGGRRDASPRPLNEEPG